MGNYDLVIDANGKILGRLASFVAKRLLEGKRVAIINAEKAIISGNPETILEKYQKRRSIEGKPKPTKGPVQPRTPDRIVWKTIRGMLPMKKAKGREALRRLRVFIGVPPELRKVDILELPLEYTVENLKPKKQKKEVTVYWLAKSLGWKG
ncbi:MAG: 50S ribosomal protein L13 [Thermoproteota archaeon]|nr:MAG: 50S ribosomal protein L13 [Candidatus Korarchaeota archaeon]RLG49343.1 MAG: 50S ribosomal protein L13 [Candidatus Korarchaeota archaeon]RLG53056.1 MAG: 50S ribosomal protein L13 [Candidatus Korarchaeota archaeon]